MSVVVHVLENSLKLLNKEEIGSVMGKFFETIKQERNRPIQGRLRAPHNARHFIHPPHLLCCLPRFTHGAESLHENLLIIAGVKLMFFLSMHMTSNTKV